MGCTACGHENDSDDRFCAECGAPLDTTCGACDAELKPGAKFCTKCGATVAVPPGRPSTSEGPAPLLAQRKTITVVFGDVGGSTGLGERLDPEAAREVMNQYHRDVLDVIGEHGGTVDKFNGDGFMATFGIPEVNEDDAARAVAAAVEIQKRFAPFAAEVQEHHGGEAITLRIGVNTGEIVIAEGDPDIIGDALNVAARLERACPAGRVLVGAETWRLTRGGWSYEPQGEVTVAGRVEPVEVHLVGDPMADVVGDVDAATPFVGREHELDVLRSTLGDCIEEARLRLVTVVGSPGLGKTRLASEAVRALDAHHSLTIRCERAGTTTFAPIADLIRTVAGVSDGTSAEPIADAIDARFAGEDDASRIGPALAGVVGAGPARSTEETFWAVRRLVETLGREGPTVLVVDDIQWAEPVVLDLLEHLAEWVTGAGVLLVCLARPEIRDVRPSFTEPGRRAAHVVSLEGLDAAATNQLASRMLGAELPRDLVDRLPSSTEGNPLFVRELVKMLVADEVIRRADDGRWELTIDAGAVEVPPTIQSLLAARLDRLDPQERGVLERAAVIGPEFAEGALRALLDDGDDLRAVLERLRRMDLVEPTGSYWGDEPLHRFHHVLIRDAAYRRLLKGARADLHERVAAWTEARDGESRQSTGGSLDESIAFHEEQAHRYRRELGPLDQRSIDLGHRAARRLTAAAERALARDDLTAAASLSSRALACLGADSDQRSDLLLMACEAHLGTGDVVTGEALVDDLDALATDDRTRAWATCFRAQLISMTEPDRLPEAERDATTAAGVLEALRDDAGAAKGHLTRARILALLGRIGDAESELDLALTAAREADDSRRITAVLGNAPLAALWGPSPVPRAGGRCLDIVRLLRITTRAPAVEATSMRCQALLEALRGRFDTARKMIDRCRRKTAELGLRLGALETELFAGQVEWLAGELDDAETALRTAYTGLSAMRLGAEAGLAGSLLARVLVRGGGLDEADVLIGSAEQMAGRNLKTAAAWRVAKAELLLARGETEAAIDVARAAVEVVEHTDFVVDQADVHLTLAKALRAGGQSGDADERRARDLADAKGAPALIGDDAAAGKPAADPTDDRVAAGDMARVGSWNPDETLVAQTWATHRSRGPVEWTSDFVHEDFRRGMRDSRSVEDQPVLDPSRQTGTVLAFAGDRAGLAHNRQEVGLDYEIESLVLTVVDTDGRVEWNGVFDPDDLDRALDVLWDHYRRHCEEDGVEPIDNVAARTGLASTARINLGDGDGALEFYAADFVGRTRRRLDVDYDVDQQRENVRSVVASGWSTFTKALEVHGEHRVLGTTAFVGPPTADTDTVPFSGDTLFVYTTDDMGLITDAITFAVDQLDEARAELHRTPDSSQTLPPWTDPPVITTWSKFVALDPSSDDFADLVHPEAEFVYRRRSLHEEIDAPTAIERFRMGFKRRTGSRILAVLGDRLGLFLETFDDDEGYEAALVRVVEVDGGSQIVGASAWDREDVDAAFDAMWDRHDEMTAGDPDPAHRRLSAFRRWMHDCAYLNLGDLDRAWRDSAGDVTWENHRPGERPETRSESRRSHEAMVASGVSVIAEPIVVVGGACLNRLIYRSPTEPGTVPFTTEVLCADFRSPGGKVERTAVWNVDQFDEALADLRRRARSSSQQSFRSPLRTPIARAGARFARSDTLEAALGFVRSDAVIRDHRPGLKFEGGREFGFADDAGNVGRFREMTWLAILGERAGLSRNVIELDGGFERIAMPVFNLDHDARIASLDRFGPDQVDEALDLLWERYHENCAEDGVEAIDNRAARFSVRSCVLMNLGELEAALDLFTSDFQLVTKVPGETSDRVVGREQQSAFASYLRDTEATIVPSLVAIDGTDRALLQFTFIRPNLDGEDEWINTRLQLCELDEESGLLRRQTVYRDDQLDEALADLRRRTRANREKALGSPLETPIVRAAATYAALANEDPERAVEQLYSAGYSLRDHRPGLAHRVSKGEIPSDFVRLRGDWLAVLGARAGLSRNVVDFPGDYVRIDLLMATVGGDDRFASSDRFDPDQVDEALDLLWQRYHEHCDEDGVEPIDNPAARLAVRSCVLVNLGEAEATDLATSGFNTNTMILPTVVAVDGPDRALVQFTSVRRNRNGEYECVDANLQLFELDKASGLLRRQTAFRDDQLDKALDDLRRPRDVGRFDPYATLAGAARLRIAALPAGGQNPDHYAPDWVCGLGGGLEVDFTGWQTQEEVTPDNQITYTDLAFFGERTLLTRQLHRYDPENWTEHLLVVHVDRDGRVKRSDSFPVADVDGALDLAWERYREVCAEDGVEPVDNLPARLAVRHCAFMNVGDPEGAAEVFTPDFELRSNVPGETSDRMVGRDVVAERGFAREVRNGTPILPTLVAVDGSDRALVHFTFVRPNFDGESDWVNPRLMLCELDGHSGLIRRQTVYREDQLDEALEELRRRPDEAPPRFPSPLDTTIVRTLDLVRQAVAVDPAALFDSYDDSFVERDHRPGLAAVYDRNDEKGSFRGARGRLLAVLGDRASLLRNVVALDGGYERKVLVVHGAGRVGLLNRLDRFDVDQLDEALDVLWGRYREHCAEDGVEPIDSPAARQAVRAHVLMNLHGPDASAALLTNDFEIRNLAPGERDESWHGMHGRQLWREWLRQLESVSARLLPTLVAVDGSDRVLFHVTFVLPSGEGADWNDARLGLLELDESSGLFHRQSIYREDQLDQALADLRRRSEDEAPSFPSPLDTTIVRTLDLVRRAIAIDPAALSDFRDDEFVEQDHRPGLIAAYGKNEQDQPFTGARQSLLAVLGDRAAMARNLVQLGDDYERDVLVVHGGGRDGLLNRLDRFDVDQLDEALDVLWERYRAHCAEDGVEPIDNPAARQAVRTCVLMNLDDPDAAVEVYTEDAELRNQVPGEVGMDMDGREAFRLMARFLKGIPQLLLPTPIATVGSDRVLYRCSYVTLMEDGDVEWLNAILVLCEVDEDGGLLKRQVAYREDQLDQAMADLRRGPTTPNPTLAPASPFDTIAVAATLATSAERMYDEATWGSDFVFTDHRPGMAAESGPSDFEFEPRVEGIQAKPLAVIGQRAVLSRNTVELLGGYEREVIAVTAVGKDGAVRRLDRFDVDQLDEALDLLWERYLEHCAEDGVEPVDNAAARRTVHMNALVNLGEMDRFWSMYAPNHLYEDRRPEHPSGPEAERMTMDMAVADGWVILGRPVAVDGDDAVWVDFAWRMFDNDGVTLLYAIDTRQIYRFDDQGRLCEVVVVRNDDDEAAEAELRRRSEPSALHDPFDSTIGRLRRATDGVGGPLQEALMSPSLVFTDHRPGVRATMTGDEWLRTGGTPNSPEPGRDLAFLGDRAVLFAAVLHHVMDDGTTYEWEVLNVHGADRDGMMATVDVFDMDQLDDALDTLWQRYHEHCAEDGVEPLENLAVLTRMRNVARWNLGEPLDDAWFSKDFAFVDRRPGEFDNHGRQEHLDLGAEGLAMRMRHYPTAIECVGTHAALFTNHWLLRSEDDGDPWVSARIDVLRFNDLGQISSMHIFDPGQLEEARSELHRPESDGGRDG